MADTDTPKGEIEREEMAKIIVEATLGGTTFAAERAGLSVKTVCRYLARSREDAALAAEVQKQYRNQGEWTADAKKTMRSITGFLYRASQELDPKNPKNIFAMTGSFKLLSEAVANYEMIQARLEREIIKN